MITKRVEFENNNSEMLSGVLRIPDEQGVFPAVIICHTFHDNKDNELIFSLWDDLSRAGFVCLRFDFSGRGESQGDFKDLTISQEINDLKAAFNFLDRHEQVDSDRIGILGHSMGGIDAILFAAKHKKTASIAALSTRSDTKEFIDSYFDDYQQKLWKQRGYVQMHNKSEISADFLRDAEKHSITEEIKKIECPILMVHGTDETRVPFEDARELFNHAKEQKKLELIEGADHHFTAGAHRQELLDAVIGWFNRTLKP